MFWRSSGIRITFSIMALFVLTSGLVIGAIYWQTRDILTRRNITSVINETQTLSEIAARQGETGLLAALRARRSQPNPLIYGLADARGQTIWLGGLDRWPPSLKRDNKSGVFTYAPAAPRTPGAKPVTAPDANLAIGATLRLPDGARLLVARDVTDQRDLAGTMRAWFMAGMALLALVAIAAGWAINYVLMARLGTMSRTVDAIMAGNFSRRVPLTDSADEFDALAGHLNNMLDRIERLMQGLREVSDNIAHDLKTPLNRLRIRVEEALRDPRGDAAYREGLETTLVEADELIRTFNALLRVARLEAGTLGDNLETFDVMALVDDLAEFYEPVADDATAALSVVIGPPLFVSADRQLISQALTNLLENALKYGLYGGMPADQRRIEIGARKTDTGVELWVSDHGHGIAASDHARVLKRFVRLDRSRTQPGTGLGLSLVAAVMQQHGGTVKLTDNRPGLKVIIHLPAERLSERVEAQAGADLKSPAKVHETDDARSDSKAVEP